MNERRVMEFRERFRALHASGCFVIPNPWDIGSARLLVKLGFPALATTSSGFAWSTGRRDNHITLDDALAHVRSIASGVEVPVNADFEGGFAIDPEGVAANVARAADTGIAGFRSKTRRATSASRSSTSTLSVRRVAAARQAIDRQTAGVFLTARSEGFIVGRPDLDETIRRLTAFAAGRRRLPVCAGHPQRRRDRRRRAGRGAETGQRAGRGPFTTVEQLAALGVRRVSVGGALRAIGVGRLSRRCPRDRHARHVCRVRQRQFRLPRSTGCSRSEPS